jgi:signal transduction histidine kinase/ActR/RegA family two-component response regulator
MNGNLPSATESFEHAACGLVTAGTDGTILRVNSIFCRWLAYEPAELVGRRKVADLLTVGGKIFQQTHWGPLLQMQRSVAELKLELVRRDRTRVPMLVNVSRTRHGMLDFDHFAFMVLADRHKFEQELLRARANAERALEARLRAEDELGKASRLKDEFLATLAHELRNPLAPMCSVLDLLQRKAFDDEQVTWAHGVLQRQLMQLSHLVDDLLDVSRFNEGKIELRRTPVDLADAMRTAVEGSRPRIDAASHRLSISFPDAPVTVDADATRFSQIMQNVLNNAAKYTPLGGDIWFSGRREGEEAIIVVRDSGIGIAAEDLPSMFGMFAQLPGGKEYSQGGLGVGLALVRILTQLHGGTVVAHSDGLGKGTEFTLRLPVATATGVNAETPQDSRPMQKPCHILVVDDNRDAAESLAMLLELEGNTVWTAIDGRSGLRTLDQHELDAALLDIGLPDMSGYELASRIRSSARGKQLLLVALTGWGQQEDRAKAKAAGFDLHFTKPVDLKRLQAALNASPYPHRPA